MLRAEWLETRNRERAMVFLHDALGSIAQWKDFPAGLCAHLDCSGLIYERRGHGGSGSPGRKRSLDFFEEEVEILRELLIVYGIEAPILFGHSDGGTISLKFASRHACIPSAVISEAAHVFVEDATLKGIEETAGEYRQGPLREKLRRYHGDSADDVFRAWTDSWLDPAAKTWNMLNELAAITCPALLIQGEADQYGSTAQLRKIADRSSGPVETLLIPECGHIPHREAADEVMRGVARFLGRFPHRRPGAGQGHASGAP